MRAKIQLNIIAVVGISLLLSSCFSSNGNRSRRNKSRSTSASATVPPVRYTQANLARAITAASKTLLQRLPDYETEVLVGSQGRAQYENVIRSYLNDAANAPSFRETMVNEHRTYLQLGGAKPDSTIDFDGPGKLGSYIITENRDYREIVLAKICADWTDANRTQLRSVDCSAFKNRPAAIEEHGAGVLSMPAFIATYKNQAGFNFGLVKESLDKFSCASFPDPDDSGVPGTSLASSPVNWPARSGERNGKTLNCFMCHKSINPRAIGFYNFNREGYFVDSIENTTRRDTNAPSLPTDLLKSEAQPTAMGMPTKTLSELGEVFAKDPRFTTCMTKRYFNFALGRPYGTPMPEEMEYLVTGFASSSHRVKELLFSILNSAAFINRGEE